MAVDLTNIENFLNQTGPGPHRDFKRYVSTTRSLVDAQGNLRAPTDAEVNMYLRYMIRHCIREMRSIEEFNAVNVNEMNADISNDIGGIPGV